MLLNGITCSGWLSREELVDEVLNSDLYFHCAAWEGNPMSVLEVSRMEMPIVGRKIPSLESIGLKQLSTTPEGCAQLIYKHFNNKDSLANSEFVKVNELCSEKNQMEALKVIYSIKDNELH